MQYVSNCFKKELVCRNEEAGRGKLKLGACDRWRGVKGEEEAGVHIRIGGKHMDEWEAALLSILIAIAHIGTYIYIYIIHYTLYTYTHMNITHIYYI